MASSPSLNDPAVDIAGVVDYITKSAALNDALSQEVEQLRADKQELTTKLASSQNPPSPPPAVPEAQAAKLASLMVDRELIQPADRNATAQILAKDPVKLANTLEAVLSRIPGAPARPDGQPAKVNAGTTEHPRWA